jgi:hypothetical protein
MASNLPAVGRWSRHKARPSAAQGTSRLSELVAEVPHTHGLVNPFDPECSPTKRCLRCEMESELRKGVDA